MAESCGDAVIGEDENGVIRSWNQGAKRVLGYRADEMVGTSLARLIPADRQAEENRILAEVRSGRGAEQFETRMLTKAGRLLDVSVTISPIRDRSGGIVGVSRIARDITAPKEREREISVRNEERRQAENAVASERRFSEAMIDSMPGVLYFYDLQGRFLRWNRNFELISGYSAGEIAGMSPLDFFNPEDRPAVEARIAEVFEKGESSVEAPFRAKDGRTTPYFFTGRRLVFNDRTCLVGVGIDISERKAAESTLRRSEQRFRRTLDGIMEGCQLIGFDWRYLYLNDAAALHNRRPNAELLGRTVMDAWPGIEQTRVYTLVKRCLAEKSFAQEEVAIHFADGTTGWFDVRVQPAEEGVLVLSIDRTERKLAEDQLARSERKYRELVEHANSIILRWNSDGRITLLNEFGLRFFGYTAEEIVGRHVLDTIVPATDTGGQDLQQLIERICANPNEFDQNINENRRRNGEHVWVSWTNRVVRDRKGRVVEILSIGTDVTEHRRANEALRRSEEQFRLIMENLADLVAVVDLEGRRIYNSPSYRDILGNPNQLQGSLSFDQIHPDDQVRVQQAFRETVRTGVGHRLEYRLVDHHGEPHQIESQGSVIRDARGRVAQVVVVSRDVTERNRAEQAIRELNASLELRVAQRTEELRAALVRAEAADRIKSTFLASMSHELRTPLNSIIGFTGIVLQGLAGPLNEEQAKQLGMVRSSARHLLELINDVLDISKIEAGQLEVRSEPFDLPESLARVTASIRPLAEKKRLELVTTFSPELGVMAGDRRRVEQIILNLLNNAIKFTEEGHVTLTAEKLADYRARPDAPAHDAVRLRVADTGIGIDPADLALLFQPFRQIDTGLSRQHEGTGLGLAICRRLATLMGGDVFAASTRGQGSEFTVILPWKRTGDK